MKLFLIFLLEERVLYNPNYHLEEGDILFKRQYYDSTILYESNTKELKSIFISQNLNLNVPNNLNSLSLIHQNNNSNNNLASKNLCFNFF